MSGHDLVVTASFPCATCGGTEFVCAEALAAAEKRTEETQQIIREHAEEGCAEEIHHLKARLSDLNTKAAVLLYYSIDDLVDSYSTHLAVCKNAKEQYAFLTSQLAAAKEENERLRRVTSSEATELDRIIRLNRNASYDWCDLVLGLEDVRDRLRAAAPSPAKEQ